ncbi:hypothetical protein LWI29_026281 [Acer saccharum]|uniref:Protein DETOXIFICATION n=1 Tax=Acer saccharum TaxID=4024 RepID=A0AA39VG00_ACESA|nr:hypothetical protein LWI29_026281 [Acer saccharum]
MDPVQPLLQSSESGSNEQVVDCDQEKEKLVKRVWIETTKLWHITGPAILSLLSVYSMNVVIQVVGGHLGDVQLAAISIANNVIVGFNFSLLLGMASALDTLCGQAFGADWQRDSTCWGFMCRGQTDEVAELSGVVAQWMIPAHFSFAFLFPLQTFLQCQLKNRIIACVFPMGLVVNIFTSWLFVHVLDYGIVGASIAFDISWWFSVLGLFVYSTCGGCPLTWSGFSMHAFSGLWEFVKLSAASGVMLCLENWYYRILILMTGNLKNATLAVDALSICMSISGWEMMIPLAFLAATGVRVANELGAGNGKAAKFATVVAVAESAAIGLFFSLLILILRDKVALLFTSSDDVLQEVDKLSYLLALSILFNSIQPVLSGVAVGSGWQASVAYVNLGCYYVIGLPLGILMGWVFNLGVMGIWGGMILGGTAVQTIILAIITIRCDWENEGRKASQRMQKWSDPSPNNQS